MRKLRTVIQRLIGWMYNTRVSARSVLYLVFAIYLSGMAVLNAFSISQERSLAVEVALQNRSAAAKQGAAVLSETFGRLKDITTSLASASQFRAYIKAGKWDEAIALFERLPKDVPAIERLFVADPKGVEMADRPAVPGVRGQNFSDRDWYKGVSKEWKTYVSEVYRRAAPPQVNVLAAAAPIKADDGSVLGILVAQVRVETLLSWIQTMDFGPVSTGYVVDVNGHLAAHPRIPLQADIQTVSDDPVVAKVLSGQSGAIVKEDQERNEQVMVAYAHVPDYGWGVIVEQPLEVALQQHAHATRSAILLQLLIALFGFVVLAVLLVSLDQISLYRQREKAFLQSIGDGLVAIDQNWNIVLWNPAAESITGYPAKEAIGKPFRSIVKFLREHDRAENHQFIAEAMAAKEVRFMNGKALLVKKDGSEIPVGDSAAPVLDAHHNVLGAIIVFRDLTAERHEQMLRSSFAYASHQLRNPVTKALWNIEMALAEVKDKQTKEKVAIAYNSMLSIQKLVRTLVEVSEIDQGLVLPKKESQKIVDIIGDAVHQLAAKAKARHVSVSVSPLSGKQTIRTDKRLLVRALYEVIDNAISFSHPKSEVFVEVSERDHAVLFEVKDSGIGIPEEQQSLVFTKFFRGHNIPPETVGAGLGLFVASQYISLLGGKIWFTSQQKKGTTFSISLPRA